MEYRIYIIEDHAIMRRMIQELLTLEPDFSVCGLATSAEEALEGLQETEADLALIDTLLPGMSGIDLVKELNIRYPNLRCLMYSGHEETSHIKQALAAGADGYLLKGGHPEELPEAIRRLLDGRSIVPPPATMSRTGSVEMVRALKTPGHPPGGG